MLRARSRPVVRVLRKEAYDGLGPRKKCLLKTPLAFSYDAFISYAHSANKDLPGAIELGLERLGKRWNQRRALRVFRDVSDLPAGPDLPHAVRERMDGARFLVLLASPEAAASRWVRSEFSNGSKAHPMPKSRMATNSFMRAF